MAEIVELLPSASLVANTTIEKEVRLPYSVSSVGRVVYFKENSQASIPLHIAVSTAGIIMNVSNVTLTDNQSIALQAFSTNKWGVLGAYDSPNVTYDLSAPTGDIVNPRMESSQLFVDLRTTSKVIVLSNIATIPSGTGLCPFYTIKDIYGFAATNPFFISTTANNVIDRNALGYHIGINSNFASIDLVANPTLSKWQILNFYDGSLVVRP